MRILAILPAILLVAAVGCTAAPAAAPTPVPLSGPGLAAALQASGLPVADVQIYDADTDPNHLLGRPNQYTAKVNWTDSSVESIANNATIEVFANVADLQARQKYTDAISRTGGLFAQYIVPNEGRLALMRLPHRLTPEQADTYKAWFASI